MQMNKNLDLFPLWTAIVTPMLEDESVDYESLKKLLKIQEEAGNAIVILGSTGESLNIDNDEKEKILDFTLSLNLKVPIMAGVGGINLKDTLKWIEYLNTLPLDAYLIVTPLYAKPGEEGQYHWFKTLLDASSKPVMLYNVPGRTAVGLNFNTVKRLSNHPKFWGIKEASGSPFDFKRYMEMAPNAKIYSGDDAMLPMFASFGAKGLISVASNVWPNETREYVAQSLKQSLVETELWKECSDTLFIASNPVPVKVLLHHLKLIKTPILRAPLSHLDLKNLKSLSLANESIVSWYEDQKEKGKTKEAKEKESNL